MDSLLYLLIGAYTTGLSEGVYLYKFDTTTGDAQYVSVGVVDNPSYIDVGNGEYLYAVTENGDNPSYANVLHFDKEQEKLSLLNQKETFASSPCYIIADTVRNYVITANYGGGSISLFKVEADTLMPLSQLITLEGAGLDTIRQSSPHVHCVQFSPDGKYVFATDLGTDQIHRFTINPEAGSTYLNEGSLKSFKLAGGSGPRHLVFHPTTNNAYVINELSGAVTGFTYNNGELKEFQSIQADTVGAHASADIHISPDGQFLYASNRNKGDGVAIFSINKNDGKLTKVGYQPTGRHPRNFLITPNGKYLLVACMDSNLIQVFEIDKTTGLLTNTGKDIVEVDMPVCLKFLP
jgi:6-phosphogluconolactonase (cycloisomerase 2 family)